MPSYASQISQWAIQCRTQFHCRRMQDFCPQSALVLNRTTLRKLKVNTPTRQLLINLAVSIKSMVDATLLLLIQHDLQNLASILLSPQSLSDNLNREHEIGEDSVMNSGQSSGTGSLLGERGAGTVGALGAGENAA